MNNNKDINLIIEEFKQGLVNSVNQSNLPLAVCYYVMKDVFNELVSTYENYIKQVQQTQRENELNDNLTEENLEDEDIEN